MTVEAETVVENQTLDITKVEEPFKTDKEVIALEEAEEKKDEEKKDEEKEEATEEVTEEKKEVKEKKKPVVNKKDFEEDVVYLFQLNRSSQIPSISPLCLQVESFLKLHGIKFENVDLKSKLWSKEGKMLPFIELNGEKIVDSNIFETLSKKFEKEIDANLTEDQKKVQEEMTELVEKRLYWAIVNWRSVDHENLLKGYKMVVPTTLGAQLPPAAIKVYFNYTYCRKGLKQVKTSEFAANTAEEIEQFGKDDLKKLSEKLGEQKLFFGDDVSSLDLVVFSYVAQIAMVEKEQPCALREYLETDCKNLLELIEAVKEKVWGEDWEKATGEKIQMNPHIEVEAEEEKVEEKKEGEEVVEEKKEEEGEDKKEEDKEIKRNRGGTLSRIRGAFDMKKFAKAEKAEAKKEEAETSEEGEKKAEEGETTEETEKKEVEAEGEKKEVTEDKEDITDITEEKTEEKKKAGTLSRMMGIFDMKKVEKEEKEEKEGAEEKDEEKTDEESPKKESTLTRMLSIFKKNKPVVVKKNTEDEEDKLEEEEKETEKETKEESSAEAKEIVKDIVNEIADVKDLSVETTEPAKELSKETEEL